MSRQPFPRKTVALRKRGLACFEAAVQNISEGLCMFDAARKLVICNAHYASMYQLPDELTKRGTAHASIVKFRLENGMEHLGDEGFLDHHENLLREGTADAVLINLRNGRTISIRHQPLPDGGWVATHRDVSDEMARAAELSLQKYRLEAALDNMTQGLCMFDRHKLLIVSNRRYAEMYNISPDNVKPGMELANVLQQRLEAGNVPRDGINVFLDKRVSIASENEPCAFEVEMNDGRVISIRHQPMADGGWVATHEDITEQRQYLARIQHLAGHDTLTDLPNRIQFERHLEHVNARVQLGETLAILCVDLDHFKAVNDALGHAYGDLVLKNASRILLNCVHDGDVVARLGGDEFVILAGRLENSESAACLAKRIVDEIAEPMDLEGHRVLVGASVGIAVASIDGEDGASLIKRADMAMYRAKGEGRGTYNFYQEDLDAALQERRELEAALRNALLQGEFCVLYQPLVNVVEQRVCAFEALVRWLHPGRGLLSPAAFLATAEESGLIAQIGELVLREACAVAAGWPEHVGIAINISPLQFKKNRDLVRHVKSALHVAGLAPERLELEITESVLLADDTSALLILRELREMGVKIALDDFGTGYSSLSYLRSFPFDKIKIDRSFVQESTKNPESLAIVKAVIALGRSLGMATTAEGVETEAQLEIVREQGCTEVQGFLFSQPLPAQAANDFIASFYPRPTDRKRLKIAG